MNSAKKFVVACTFLVSALATFAFADDSAKADAATAVGAATLSNENKTATENKMTTENKAAVKTSAEKTQQQKQNDEQPAAIKLESVFVGDKEQPAISYFIPWQGIGTPDKLYWNVEEKHDNALGLVDRDIMLRSIHFYEEMNLEAVPSP